MAITRELWAPTIVEKLFADDTFASRSVDHSAFVMGSKVHVPNAGSKPNVVKNRSTFPATVTDRTDVDLDYDIDSYTTDPVRVGNAEEIELSYDKRTSVMNNTRMAVVEKVHLDVLSNWIASATGTNQKKIAATFNRATLQAIKLQFDKDDVPQEGRCVALTPDAYSELLADLAATEQFAFSASADSARGIIGKLFGFDVYMRSTVDNAASSKVSAFAWQEGCVSRAIGDVKIFDEQDSAQFYGDIISAEILAGGAAIRNDGAGIFKITTA